ncbi:MAG: ABC-F family ATP-binding cassette domain-containing protein, partial [Phycisphaerales bacterium]
GLHAGAAVAESAADAEADLAWQRTHAVDQVLSRMALPGDVACETLSSGMKRRVLLAQAIVSAPDLLLLDEPTNHLDIETIDWLETFLDRWTGTLLFVTHDRAFLERVATRIVELSRAPAPPGTRRAVDGNYPEFLRRRGEFLEAQARGEATLANEVRIDDAWLGRGAQARRTKAKGRIEDSAERRDELAAIAARNAAAAAGGACVDFSASGRRTRRLVQAVGIAKGFGGRTLFKGLDLELGPGDRLGLMGPNGSGKSTLLAVLCGELAPDAGSVRTADPAPRVVFLRQQRAEIPPQMLLRDAICPLGDFVDFQGRPMHITAWARQFLFADAQLLQPVGSLSGGERARALIARMMLEPADILVLDEPTNDLDIPTLEVLERAMEAFPGAVVLVTHDRAMLAAVARQVVVLGAPGGQVSVVASLDQALAALERAEQASASALRASAAAPVNAVRSTPAARRKLGYMEQRELDGMESAIESAERTCA